MNTEGQNDINNIPYNTLNKHFLLSTSAVFPDVKICYFKPTLQVLSLPKLPALFISNSDIPHTYSMLF